MAWHPRPYQQEAIDATFDYWDQVGGNPLIVIPTGGGKAGVLGTIMRRLFDDYPGIRIVNVTHSAELVGQNYDELIGMWEWAPAGVYQAQLGRRDTRQQILFCGIQSVWNKVAQLGDIDLIIIDEAHAVPKKADTMYGKFLAAVRAANPGVRLLGLTATDYRLDSGRLAEGDDKLFDDVAYEINLRELVADGYLTPLIGKGDVTTLSTAGVRRSGGDFKAGDLQKAVDKAELNRAIVDDIVRYGVDRRSWLGFAAGVEHAHHLAEETRSRGFSAAVLDGTTDPGVRKKMIADFKAYRLRCLWNCGVLTTGFNHPGVDLIAAARPTESAGLYVQIAGRGTRNVYAPGMPLDTREQRLAAIAAGPKPNCLFLDFGKLVRSHGPIDMVQPKKPGKGGGDAPVKTCPEGEAGGCGSIVHASVMECPDCGYEWERQLSEKITKSAAALPIMSKGAATWRVVGKRRFSRHEKFGANPSMKVEYICPEDGATVGNLAVSNIFPEWISLEHASESVRGIAARWWTQQGGADPVPETVTEALKRVSELKPIEQIRIEPNGKFYKISGRRFGGTGEDQSDVVDSLNRVVSNLSFNKPAPAPVPLRAWEIDEEVPF